MRGSAIGTWVRRSARRAAGIAAAGALAATGLVGLGANTVSANAAGCAPIHVVGTAATASKVLRRHAIAISLHDHGHPLGGGRTGKNGGFDVTVCRSPALRKYAHRHSGHINLDVLTHRRHKGGKFFMRATTARYASSTVAARRGFIAASMVNETANDRPGVRGGSVHATGVASTKTAIASPTLMYVQTVRHMHADYTVESSDGFESVRTLKSTKKKPRRAILVKPELAISSQYTCLGGGYNPYFGGYLGSDGNCSTESSGRWTGPVHTRKTASRGCYAAGLNVLRFSNRNQKELATTSGVTFSSTVKVAALGSSWAVTAEYGTSSALAETSRSSSTRPSCT